MMYLRHWASFSWVGTHPVDQGKPYIRSRDLQDKCARAYKSVSLQSRATNQVAPSSKIGAHPGMPIMSQFVSVGDALGWERPATPMSSYFAGRSGCMVT